MTLTCDEAFDVLTDPFETDRSGLERHLATCARCRQMRDVIAPGLTLFAGEAPPERACSDGSPAPDGKRDWISDVLAQTSPEGRRVLRDFAREFMPRWRRRRRIRRLLWTSAVLLLGGALAFGVATTGTDDPEGAQSGAPAAAVCLWTSSDRSPPQPSRAEQVILSCVACHLPASGQ
ncbi:MAG TPA: hypothetical protein VML55_23380 [Planctomycetaceae bacterium]|nr:hypothetical protein [Planctomycetaceae bacterium]